MVLYSPVKFAKLSNKHRQLVKKKIMQGPFHVQGRNSLRLECCEAGKLNWRSLNQQSRLFALIRVIRFEDKGN